jgi:hypothetical protein
MFFLIVLHRPPTPRPIRQTVNVGQQMVGDSLRKGWNTSNAQQCRGREYSENP